MLCPCAVTCTRLVLLLLFLFRPYLSGLEGDSHLLSHSDTDPSFQRKRVSWLIKKRSPTAYTNKKQTNFYSLLFQNIIQKFKKKQFWKVFLIAFCKICQQRRKKLLVSPKNKRVLDCTTLINTIIITPV